MDTLGFLVIGTLAGAAAGRVMGHRLRLLDDAVVGVIGSLLGGYVFGLLGMSAYGSVGSFVTALVGSVLLLYLVDILHLSHG